MPWKSVPGTGSAMRGAWQINRFHPSDASTTAPCLGRRGVHQARPERAGRGDAGGLTGQRSAVPGKPGCATPGAGAVGCWPDTARPAHGHVDFTGGSGRLGTPFEIPRAAVDYVLERCARCRGPPAGPARRLLRRPRRARLHERLGRPGLAGLTRHREASDMFEITHPARARSAARSWSRSRPTCRTCAPSAGSRTVARSARRSPARRCAGRGTPRAGRWAGRACRRRLRPGRARARAGTASPGPSHQRVVMTSACSRPTRRSRGAGSADRPPRAAHRR